MAHRSALATVLFAALAACGDTAPDAPPIDASIDAPIDAMRSVICAREGTSSVTGSGPSGSLGASHVYALGLTGFCQDSLVLVVTIDDPLASPYLSSSGVILAPVLADSLRGTAEWSGTFAARISLPDGTPAANGTLQVDQATSGFVEPTRLRATAQFDDGDWHFTATIDAPYCTVTVCF